MHAIEIQDIWKTYHRNKARRADLRQSLSFWWKNALRHQEKFNALEGINLNIEKGDVVGLIGPNGAGKSTLLRILSRITYPSKGKIIVHGQLASLLEAGVGFHPELSGRDNIFINSIMHGMSKAEVSKKFDSIVDFSGLEEYLETPVKHFSTGMAVRLAFAVSSHLNADILLLDEVLGAGDAEFKIKSQNKLNELINNGNTVLMVSHDLDMLRAYCKKGIYLDHGRIISIGDIDTVTEGYLSGYEESSSVALAQRTDRSGSGKVKINSIRFCNKDGLTITSIASGQHVIIEIMLTSSEKTLKNIDIRLDVFDKAGRQWMVMANKFSNGLFSESAGQPVFECEVKRWPLSEGHYLINAAVSVDGILNDSIQQAVEVPVLKGNFYPTGRYPDASRGVLIDYQWRERK